MPYIWASCQIRKIAGCACAGNAGNVFPRHRLQRKPLVSDPGMHHGTCVTHVPWCMSGSLTVFFKTRGHLLVWAPPRLASSGLAWPCLAMPCHALSCLAWVWIWRFFVQYKKWDSYGGVVLMRFSRYLQSDYSRLITIWAKCIYIFWYFVQKHRFTKDIYWWLGT